MSQKNRIRLYITDELKTNKMYDCSAEQTHYLINVMRQGIGGKIYVFNGKDGEFEAFISAVSKKSCTLTLGKKYALFEKSPDIMLMFTPLKKDNLDFVVQKAVELGARYLQPIITEYTNAPKLKSERLKAQIIEAAEQSRRLDLPELLPIQNLSKILQDWDKSRNLLYFDETGKGLTFAQASKNMSSKAALLIGPEGGFSEKEFEILRKLSYTQAISLGKRILRAETAAIAALSCWQAFCGDWR